MLKRVNLVKEEIWSIFFFPLFFFDVLQNNVDNVLYMDICLRFLHISWIFIRVACFYGNLNELYHFIMS